MKEKAAVYTFIVLVITIITGSAGINVMRGVYLNEIHMVQNIAGQVISAYPETEYAFMKAVNNINIEDISAGAAILLHYGYDEEEKIEENASYKGIIGHLKMTMVSFFVISFLFIVVFLHDVERRRKRQEEAVLSILADCLDQDYTYINDLNRLRSLDNPLFADTLVKLGRCLQLKTKQLNEERDNTKSLVTDISHQLKNPVSALKACFTIYTEIEEAEDREEFWTRCRMQMDKLEALVVALIQISRLETNMITLAIEEVSLFEILLGAVNTVYHKAQKKQISIETADFENISLKLDKKWTIEAVANVLDNSIKYSPKGSKIKIKVIKLYNYARVEIEDNGIGIPKAEWNKIFKRFYRVNNELVNASEGSGVGLYLARKILEDEGGTIFVRPARGQGSIFCLNLLL